MRTILTDLGLMNSSTLAIYAQQLSQKTSVGVNAARSCLQKDPESAIRVKAMLKD